jgi:hypothetical protein
MAYVEQQAVLIIIVLISNLLANALRKYYGKKVKIPMPLTTQRESSHKW